MFDMACWRLLIEFDEVLPSGGSIPVQSLKGLDVVGAFLGLAPVEEMGRPVVARWVLGLLPLVQPQAVALWLLKLPGAAPSADLHALQIRAML